MNEEYKMIARTAALAGQIMLESHAESYRVESTTRHILQTSGLSITEVTTNTTSIFLTLGDEALSFEPITIIRRIDQRHNKLNRIYRVNKISRMLSSKEITIEEAYYLLLEVNQSEYTVFSKDIANILMVMAFVVVLGGSFWDVIFSAFTGILVSYARIIRTALDLNNFIYVITTTFIIALTVNILTHLIPLPLSNDLLVIGGLIPMYPGTVVTNGIRDMLKGDYISGVARIADALVTATSLAVGVAAGLFVYRELMTWLIF